MMKTCVVQDGIVRMIGEWDYDIRPVQVGTQLVVIEPERINEETGETIPAITEEQPIYEDQVTRPLPDGAIIEEREIVQNADGDFVALALGQSVIDLRRTEKIADLNKSCNQSILSGFVSSALGSPHAYDFDYEAQINLAGMMGCVNAGLAPQTILWKTEQGVMEHNTTRFTQLYMDGLMFKQQQIDKYWTLKEQVLNATTEADVESIVW